MQSILYKMLLCLALLVVGSPAIAFDVTTNKTTYLRGESIRVNYTGFATQTDWITIVKANAPTDTYKEWYYTKGNFSGNLTFKGLSPGIYEVRAYCCWQPGRPGHGGYNVKDRQRFTVVEQGNSGAPGEKQKGYVCRQLRPGEPYYDKWSACCDIGNNRSNWTKRSNGKTIPYNGSCNYWGIYGN